MLETRRLELQSQMDAALAVNDAAQIEAIRRTIDREAQRQAAQTNTVTVNVEGN